MSLLERRKILFAPHEIGGQMELMAQELRRRGYFATSVCYTQNWLKHVNDIHINLHLIQNPIRRQYQKLIFTIWAASNYDIFHFFWGESLFGLRQQPHLDLPILKRLGKKIFVHFRGLDLVDISYFDYLRAKTAGEVTKQPPMSRPDQLHSLSKWRRYADALLVSEPDLLRVVPEAELIQQTIDTSYWAPVKRRLPSENDGVIRILHAPTRRRKKGTEFIEQAIENLKEAGYSVELVLVEKLPASEVKAFYEKCDIAVDQVLYGWHGKFSVELMAMSKPVVCYIDSDLLRYRTSLPIVNASPSTLTEQLKLLVSDPDLRRKLGQEGREYAVKYHSVENIIDRCLELYAESYS